MHTLTINEYKNTCPKCGGWCLDEGWWCLDEGWWCLDKERWCLEQWWQVSRPGVVGDQTKGWSMSGAQEVGIWTREQDKSNAPSSMSEDVTKGRLVSLYG